VLTERAFDRIHHLSVSLHYLQCDAGRRDSK
jgi:hypothetical protein